VNLRKDHLHIQIINVNNYVWATIELTLRWELEGGGGVWLLYAIAYSKTTVGF